MSQELNDWMQQNLGPSTPYITSIKSNVQPVNYSGAISQAMSNFQKAQDAANAANTQRYNQGLGQYDAANAALTGSNSDQLATIEDNRVKALGSNAQSAISRGLGNSTIVDSLNRGTNSDASRLVGASNNALAQQQSGLDVQKAGFIAARNDTAPDPNQLTSLIQSLSQYGGGNTAANIKIPTFR